MIKKILLTLIILSLCIYPSLAETFEETYSEESYQYSGEYSALTTGNPTSGDWSHIVFYDYTDNTKYTNLYFWTYEGTQIYSSEFHVRNNRFNIYTDDGKLIASGLCNWDINFNQLGAQIDSQFWATFDFIDNTKITSQVGNIFFDDYTPRIRNHRSSSGVGVQPNTNAGRIGVTDTGTDAFGGRVAIGTYQTVLMVDWTNTVSGTYNEGYMSNIKLKRDGLISNFSVYDSTGGLIRNDKSTLDLDFDIIASEYSYLLINPIYTEYTKTLTAQEVKPEYYLLKSKDGILAINESVTISVYPTLNYNELNRIVWNSYPVDANDNTISGESYLKNYVRYNDTHWQYTEAKNSALISNGIIPQTELTNSLSINFSSIANYRITCNLFDKDNLNLGNPQINVNVGNAVSDLLQYFVRTVDAETANGISGATLRIYKITEAGEVLDQTIIMSGSQQEVLLSSGEIYVIHASKTGYAENSYTFTATESKTFTMYLSKSSDVGYSTVTFIVYDANNNRLQNAIVNLNGTIKYTNQAGITTFDNLLSDCNHPYNVSLANYQGESGTVYTDSEIKELFIKLYTITEIYPTPTETESPSWITEKPTNMKDSFLLTFYLTTGIEDLETLKLLSGVMLSALIGILAASITKDGTGFILGGIIGFVGAIGLGWIPIWVLIALIVITGCYFIFSRGDS